MHDHPHGHAAVGGDREGCWICVESGGQNPKSHSWERCFCNSQGTEYRPDMLTYRMERMRARGLQPSDRLRRLNERAGEIVASYRDYATIDELAANLEAQAVRSDLAWQMAELLVDQAQMQEAADAELPPADFVGFYTHVCDGRMDEHAAVATAPRAVLGAAPRAASRDTTGGAKGPHSGATGGATGATAGEDVLGAADLACRQKVSAVDALL